MRLSRIIASLALLLAAGWSGAWVYGRARVDAEIDPTLARLADRGLNVSCPGRAVGGYPLALSVHCANGTLALPDGTTVEAATLDVGASVTDWQAVTVRTEAPLQARLANGRLIHLTSGTLTLTVHHDGHRPTGVDVDGSGLLAEATLGGAPLAGLKVASLAVKLRDAGATATGEVSAEGVDVVAGDKALAPAPGDLKGHVTLTGFADLHSGAADLIGWAADGGKLLLDDVSVSFGKTAISASGEARIAENGQVNADITTLASGTDKLPATAKAAGRGLSPAFAGLGMAYMILGKKADGGGRRIDVTVRDGAISAAGQPLGQLPPLF
jgi:hypothetical protein